MNRVKRAEPLWKIIVRCIVVILLCTFFGGSAAVLFFEAAMEPEYESSVAMIVSTKNADDDNQVKDEDGADLPMLVNTCATMVTSDAVLNSVCTCLKEEKDILFSEDKLRNMVKVSLVENTAIFTIVVRNTNRCYTMDIANMFADVAPEIITDYVGGSCIEVVDYASLGELVTCDMQDVMVAGLLIGQALGIIYTIIKISIYFCRKKGSVSMAGQSYTVDKIKNGKCW